MKNILCIVLSLFVALPPLPALAWSEGGHHLIAVLAFRQLARGQQTELLRILKSHPRYAGDFEPPQNVRDEELWLIGRAGYWPDVARREREYNRPNWHYQLGSTLIVGDVSKVNVPAPPGCLPTGANLRTGDLHIAQALELCQKVLADKSKPDSDRAIALCWIVHLVADAHQPCHAGSLYAETLFPQGDHGANSIKTRQSDNLHALWDGLLGPRYSVGGVKRRVGEIEGNKAIQSTAQTAVSKVGGMEFETWLQESRDYAERFVYAEPVMQPITVAVRSGSKELPEIDLPELYLKEAGAIAHFRAAEAGKRLAKMLSESIQ